MGNRAVITTKKGDRNTKLGVYLHWQGGRDSVEAFLKYCKIRGFRRPEDDDYGWARLTQVIANYAGKDGLSVGVNLFCKLDYDNWNNGTYLIEDWEIVGREYFDGEEQDAYQLEEMLIDIDRAQPIDQQVGREFILEQLKLMEK